jgi:hypothetical protein
MSSEKDNLALSLWYLIKTASKRKQTKNKILFIAEFLYI